MNSTEHLRPQAYSVANFSKVYGLSRSTLYEMMSKGQLHSVRVGGRRLIPASEGEKLLKGVA